MNTKFGMAFLGALCWALAIPAGAQDELAEPKWHYLECLMAGASHDWKSAYQLCSPLAEQGDAGAQFMTGLMYRDGLGVEKDDMQAVHWFRKSAEQGEADAQSGLAFMYSKGKGVIRDYEQAELWFRKAAEQGDANAQYNLGSMYARGEGVPKNYIEAYKWSNLASAQGDENAKRHVNLLELHMSSEQISEAQKQSAEWYKARKKIVDQ